MLFDAHNHLQDDRLDPHRRRILADLPAMGVAEVVVNGSSEDDWPAVAALARAHAWIRPAFGLHPWYVKQRTPQWQSRLAQWLDEFPHAVVGEIGLDRWIENPDIEAQMECFRWQMYLAVERGRPAEIHCLRAWGMLDDMLRSQPLPAQGFLLHSYGGPAEMIPGFVKLGACFSLSPYFAHPRKAAQLAVFSQVPLDRLLAESDAPDMWPPEEMNPHPLTDLQGKPINHPANLELSYQLIAQVKDLPVAAVRAEVAANYRRLFSSLPVKTRSSAPAEA